MLIFSCDGCKVTVPTFIQPESEQRCLIGMNVIPFLGATIRRANGKPLHAIVEREAQVRLVQTTTIPGQKGRLVEAQVENGDCLGDHSACLSLLNHPRPSGKLARWALTIQEMNLVIKHQSGKSNTNADALSHNPVHERTANKNSCKDDEDVESSPSEENHTSESLPCRISAQPHECTPKPSFSVNGCEEVVAGYFNVNACTEKKNVSDCDCMQTATQEIYELQLKDTTLTPYFQYLEEQKLPIDESESRRIVLECEKLEIIDGVLHHDNPVDSSQWCVVVPSHLRQTLLAEAHSSVFSGHFLERKIYERLRHRLVA